MRRTSLAEIRTVVSKLRAPIVYGMSVYVVVVTRYFDPLLLIPSTAKHPSGPNGTAEHPPARPEDHEENAIAAAKNECGKLMKDFIAKSDDGLGVPNAFDGLARENCGETRDDIGVIGEDVPNCDRDLGQKICVEENDEREGTDGALKPDGVRGGWLQARQDIGEWPGRHAHIEDGPRRGHDRKRLHGW